MKPVISFWAGGELDPLILWMEQTKGVKFWRMAFKEL
uniref:Uncharacterized protein n=1 Tax=blood disease bacterium R229 TaxID=741978 RepID=G2ZSE7_9RALS|nr:hypothetical protein BDB_170054 [blood disease bacterium R229]